MKFLLTKASDRDFDGKGIKKKFNPRIEKYDRYDILQEIFFPEDCEGVFIDINSLEDLIDFENTYGEIIIGQALFNEFIKEIKIYDSYIE